MAPAGCAPRRHSHRRAGAHLALGVTPVTGSTESPTDRHLQVTDRHLQVRRCSTDSREEHTNSPRRLKRGAGATGRSRIEPANRAIPCVAATSHQADADYTTAAGVIKASADLCDLWTFDRPVDALS